MDGKKVSAGVDHMPLIHFLNVKGGDCHIIKHGTGHISVIDVCNARKEEVTLAAALAIASEATKANFRQKESPVNPIEYMKKFGYDDVFRFILTHPDMDHMDGIKDFFEEFPPTNFWDTDNSKEMGSFDGSPYRQEDWDFYQKWRKSKANPKVLHLYAGSKGKYFNEDGDGNSGGDGLYILAPYPQLVEEADDLDDYNDASYVLLYKANHKRIIFGGDSHDKTWSNILDSDFVKEGNLNNIDLLIAPHHGRDSDRDYAFLDVLMPKLTLFGNASSGHLGYTAWNNRKLDLITNNEANCIIAEPTQTGINIYVTNETFARKYKVFASKPEYHAFYIGTI